jgi:signal peptidase I
MDIDQSIADSQGAAAARPARAPGPLHPRLRLLVRLGWLVLAPAVLAVLFTALALPDAGWFAASEGLWGVLARSPVAVAVLLFVLFAALVRYWRNHLPGGQYLVTAPATARPIRQTLALVASLAVAVGAALFMHHSLVESMRVLSPSMLPSLLPYDHVVTNKLAYGLRLPLVASRLGASVPGRGDLLVFRNPEPREGASTPLMVKRVIGLPGDEIRMTNGHPTINGWAVPYCDAGIYAHPFAEGGTVGRLIVEFLDDRVYLTVHATPYRAFDKIYVVKRDEVFVLGDNRNQSVDSRAWAEGQGAGIKLGEIEGRVRRIIGSDRNGATDWARFFKSVGLDIPLPGTDVSGLVAGIDKCLKQRPRSTPPAPKPA